MRRFALVLFCFLVWASFSTRAGSYTLTDNTKIEGDPISMGDSGVVFRLADGSDSARISWDRFPQQAIRQLYDQAATAREKAMIQPLLEEQPQERAERKELTVKPITPPVRPQGYLGLFAVFGSPVGLFILVILYGANIFAAYEVAVYRNQPVGTVCGLAAIPFLGIFSPIVYVAMPTRRIYLDGEPLDVEPQTRFRATPPPSETVAPPPEDIPPAAEAAPAPLAEVPQEAPAAAALPEPIVFRRGEFSFNRRFFETRLAGFFRVVPGEAEKDMVIFIKSGRGDFTGRRISRISPTELYLQIFHENATADEMIPFTEILEVQVRHKNYA